MRVDGTCDATCGDYAKDDNGTCKYPTCASPAGLKKDGTCAKDARACNGAGALSNYYVIKDADFRKCVKKLKGECTDNTKTKL